MDNPNTVDGKQALTQLQRAIKRHYDARARTLQETHPLGFRLRSNRLGMCSAWRRRHREPRKPRACPPLRTTHKRRITMLRTVQATSAVVAVVATLWFCGTWFLARPSAQGPTPGRFGVVATSNELLPVILFDTGTGNSWTVCITPAQVKQWCSLARTADLGVVGGASR